MLPGNRSLFEMAKKKWSSERVIKEVKKLEASGANLRASEVRKVRSDLHSAAQLRYRGWYDAVRSAGISPEKYWRRRPDLERRRRALPAGSWNAERVIQKLRELKKQGEDLSCYHCQFKYQGLYNAATRYLGSWGKAIDAAGIDYQLVRKRRGRSGQEELLTWLRTLQSQGVRLNRATIASIDGSRLSAIEKRFGSYRSAIEKLGFDYDSIKGAQVGRKYWTKSRIIDELKLLRSNGEDVRPSALSRNHSGLMDSAYNLFTDSEEMYAAAGIDVTQIGMLKKWTRERVILTLRELRSNGEDVRPRALCKKHAGLYKSAISFFGNCPEMYRAAGIDTASIDYRAHVCRRYSKERVIEILKRLDREGEDISPSNLQRNYVGLYTAGRRLFASSSEMYSASGLDPNKCARHKHGYWTRAKVLELIRELDSAGEDLVFSSVRRHHGDLANASTKYFGGWHEACRSAGIALEKYQLQASANLYDKEWVIQEIRKLQEQGEDLNWQAVRKGHFLLSSRAVNRFGGWYDAVEGAGISSEKYRRFAKEGFWTEARILGDIRALDRAGEDLSHNQMQKEHGALLSAAVKRFGSWKGAVSRAGLDYSEIRRQHARYTDKELLDYLRDLHSRGVSLDTATMKLVNESMLNVIWNRFGTYRKAIEAIGLNYDEILKRKTSLSRQSVVSGIVERHHQGKSLSAEVVKRDDSRFFYAATKLFRSWFKAVEAAGIDSTIYRRIKSSGYWTKERVVSEIVRLRDIGEDLSYPSVRKSHGTLAHEAGVIFGGWYEALEASGISSAVLRRRRVSGFWNRERVIDEVRRLHESHKDLRLSSVRKNDSSLIQYAIKYFGGWYPALELLGIDSGKYCRKRLDVYWSKEKVVEKIRELSARNEDLHRSSVLNKYSTLVAAADRSFGGWLKACEEASMRPGDYAFRKPRGYWTEENIKKEIISRAKAGEDLSYPIAADKLPSLVAAVENKMGSWYEVLEICGLRSYRKQHKRYTDDELLDFLRSAQSQGFSLAFSSVRDMNASIVHSIVMRFGTYRCAIERLGLNYDAIRKDALTEGFKGIVFEKYAKKALELIGMEIQYNRLHRFEGEGCKPDFVDLTDGTWMDAKLNCRGSGVDKTIAKYLNHVERIRIIYLNGEERIWPNRRVSFIPISDLYENLRERGGGEGLVDDFEKLKKGILRPEYQTQLKRFIKKELQAA
jgi:hypothetical protein